MPSQSAHDERRQMEAALDAALDMAGYATWSGARVVCRRGTLGLWFGYTCSSWNGSVAANVGIVWPEVSVLTNWLSDNTDRLAADAPVFAWTLSQFDSPPPFNFDPRNLGGYEKCAAHILSVTNVARGRLVQLLDPRNLIAELRSPSLLPAVPSEYALRALPVIAHLVSDRSTLDLTVRDVEGALAAERSNGPGGAVFVRIYNTYLERLEALRGGQQLPDRLVRRVAALNKRLHRAHER